MAIDKIRYYVNPFKMKMQRREFIEKTFAFAIGISVSNSSPGYIRNEKLIMPGKNTLRSRLLIVNEIQYDGEIDIEKADQLLEMNAKYQSIDILNWPSYSYKPDVKFKIAYCQNQVLLKYDVTEETILAKESKINGNVCRDSCVEFFISTHKDGSFYNFEFSCIGIPHAEYGIVGKRELLDPEIVRQIKVRSSLGNQPFTEKKGGHHWELMIIIPPACFVADKDLVFKGLNASANFYKCGDDTAIPHYVTWNPVGTEHPDYHQPAFFGDLSFH